MQRCKSLSLKTYCNNAHGSQCRTLSIFSVFSFPIHISGASTVKSWWGKLFIKCYHKKTAPMSS